jgi:transcription termination/antitermination protein NusG
MRWYVIHALSGYEEKVVQTLKHLAALGKLGDNVNEILVPYETKVETVKGKKRTVQKKMYPGYVLVRMNLTNDVRHAIRQVQGVIGFIGSAEAPQPLSDDEVSSIFNRMSLEEPEIEMDYDVGDTVKVVSGPFTEAIGKVREIEMERRKVKIMVSVFGRDTQVELDFEQVEPFEPELATEGVK